MREPSRKRLTTAGQSTLEYVVLIACVVSAIIVMQIYAKRAVEGRLRASSDQIGQQWDPLVAKYKTKISGDSERLDTLSVKGVSVSKTQGLGDVQERKSVVNEEITAPTNTKLF